MEKSTFKVLFASLAILLLVLPFVTTFNELLTTLVMKIKFYRFIQSLIVPFEAKMVTVILKAFGMTAIPTLTGVRIGSANTIGNHVTISWNCIGWQSFILLVISLVTGLQGPYQILTKIQTIITGVTGTFLLNIFRITFIIVIAQKINPVAAVIFHDYFSTLIIVAWLFFFWWFSYSFILEK